MCRKLIIINVVLLIIGSPIRAQPDFSADSMLGCDTLTVQFTDLSIGATSWEWDFGDGTSSIEQNPQHFYAAHGLYNVTLTINGSAFETKDNFIEVVPTPDSTFWYSDTLALGSYNYVFRNTFQAYEDVVDYNRSWQISDGALYSSRIFLHTFADTGIYQVGLVVSVDQLPQCRSSSTRRLQVRNEIYIPNVFSPNGDSNNELFIIGYNGVTALSIYIYSRFGNLVYKDKAPVIVWDGIGTNGQEMNEGVYYYVLTSDDGEISKTGFFHLYR